MNAKLQAFSFQLRLLSVCHLIRRLTLSLCFTRHTEACEGVMYSIYCMHGGFFNFISLTAVFSWSASSSYYLMYAHIILLPVY